LKDKKYTIFTQEKRAISRMGKHLVCRWIALAGEAIAELSFFPAAHRTRVLSALVLQRR